VSATFLAMHIGFNGVVIAAIGLYALAGVVFRGALSANSRIS
jgi:hypothetical protein